MRLLGVDSAEGRVVMLRDDVRVWRTDVERATVDDI